MCLRLGLRRFDPKVHISSSYCSSRPLFGYIKTKSSEFKKKEIKRGKMIRVQEILVVVLREIVPGNLRVFNNI